jgi:hypothetical protein
MMQQPIHGMRLRVTDVQVPTPFPRLRWEREVRLWRTAKVAPVALARNLRLRRAVAGDLRLRGPYCAECFLSTGTNGGGLRSWWRTRMDQMTIVPRTLVNVQRELSVALQHKTRDMLKIGSLLNEARRSNPFSCRTLDRREPSAQVAANAPPRHAGARQLLADAPPRAPESPFQAHTQTGSLILLRHEIFCVVGGNLRAQQGHRGRARASATISR